MTERLFKVLNTDGSAYLGGNGKWSLPQNGEPGEWMPPIEGELMPCENGYHLCREKDLVCWIGPTIYAAEYRGERKDNDDKIVVREARLLFRYDTWNERAAQLFACDCAERVVHLCSDDERPRQAIEVARRFANGDATEEELATVRAEVWAFPRAATREDAWAFPEDAARDAVWEACAVTPRHAAEEAARAVTRAFPEDVTRDAVWATERKWQTARLLQYLNGKVV